MLLRVLHTLCVPACVCLRTCVPLRPQWKHIQLYVGLKCDVVIVKPRRTKKCNDERGSPLCFPVYTMLDWLLFTVRRTISMTVLQVEDKEREYTIIVSSTTPNYFVVFVIHTPCGLTWKYAFNYRERGPIRGPCLI